MQMFLEAVGIALQAIWANKLRSFLTVIGNIVAVTSIIAVVSLVQGLNASVKNAIEAEFAADAFSVQRRGLTMTEEDFLKQQSNPRVTLQDAAAIRGFSTAIGLVMAEASSSAQIKYSGVSLDSVKVRGVTKEYLTLPSTTVEFGRVITPSEFEAGTPVVMLGWGTADRLFGTLDPIEKRITVGGIHFRVVGVAPKKGSIFGESQDEWSLISLEAFTRIFGTRQSLELTIRPVSPELVQTAKDDTRVALRIERRLKPKQGDNFGILAADTFLELYNNATSLIFTVLIGVVSLSLVVGGIVIMNIMLMVVSERTREIGLRKSLGARKSDILWQILTESITLSTFGGFVGTTLGFLVAWGISKVSPLPAIVE